ncbi:hypothetical protein C9374_007003 [Naegleria lovaniensis]|uniref:Phosphomethylpyrimidine kinase n=1 Tax=Naegleria lovaniensis TaxID=51637 RepID=A0AA88KRR3_NAELO|nr:uncharacterized protein C9374_007003 [Naegleria lovaniensis]KAG2393472.1 hypothetical protein C9374_007003 [Naegleria lovaniensis]
MESHNQVPTTSQTHSSPVLCSSCNEGLAGELILMMEQQIIEPILGLPFIREMMEGTLSEEIFRFYIIQDAIYLQTFSKVFALVATKIDLMKTPNGEQQYLFLLEQSKGALEESFKLHHEYFKKWNINAFKEGSKSSKSCLLYTSFLLSAAHSDSLLEALCACLPCYYIYFRVAQYITDRMLSNSTESSLLTDSHPYVDWIKSYSSDEFKKGVELFSAFINQYAQTASEREREKCRENVTITSQMEYLFWNSSYYMEEWPIEELDRKRTLQSSNSAKVPKAVLTIAGSDSGGGAGIQADLNTFHAHHVFGTSAIAALTAQNTLGVQGVFPVPPEFLAKQIDSVLSDINVCAVKTGMLYSSELIRVVIERLKFYKKERTLHVVVDPVMVSTSGHNLLKDEAVEIIVKEFFPISTLITPNIPEAERILQLTETPFLITNVEQSKQAAKIISTTFGISNVLVKGGHLQGPFAVDVLYESAVDMYYTFQADLIHSNNTHGTGCSLAAAIASNLAMGSSLEDAVRKAKLYVLNGILRGFNTSIKGTGHGTLNHKLC